MKLIIRVLLSIVLFIPSYILLFLTYSFFAISVWAGGITAIYSGLMVLLCSEDDKLKWSEIFDGALYIFVYTFYASFIAIWNFAIYGKTQMK